MVKHKNNSITSSNKITMYLRASRNPANREPVHEAFAHLNIKDDAGVQVFERTWGPIAERPMWARHDWPEILRNAWRGNGAALAEINGWMNQYVQTSIRFVTGRIEVEPKDLLASIFLLFLRDYSAGKIAICENPDCVQPYFVKRRASQKFCESSACKAHAQRQYALKWWDDVGKKRREKKQKKSKRGNQ